jgi:hypothetical protein
LGHAQSLGYFDRARRAILMDQLRDKFNVVFNHFALVGLSHSLKPTRLGINATI